MAQIGSAVVAILLVLVALQIIFGQDTNHGDLADRLDSLERQAQFQSCVLLTPPDQLDQAAIAECLIAPNPPE